MNVVQDKNLLWGVGVVLIILLFSFLFAGVFENLESGSLFVRYHLRGESEVDSSVLIVYFDELDIRELGGMPLKRSDYALLISVLHDLGASAIGVDVVFPNPNPRYPEYDEVLASVTHGVENVVLGGYFKNRLRNSSDPEEEQEGDVDPALLPFTYGQSVDSDFFVTKGFVPPFPKLLTAARHLGHTNFDDNFGIPLLLKYGSSLFPAMSFEVFRLSRNIQRDKVTISPREVTLEGAGEIISIPLAENGLLPLNYPGGIESLHTLPALSLVRAYDAAKRGRQPSIPPELLRGKIVLLGVIAEGISGYMSTPFSNQFPAIGMHAVALSNMLQDKFLRKPPAGVGLVIAFILGLAAVVGATMKREVLGIVLVLAALPLYVVIGIVSFSVFDLVLPLIRPLFVLLSTTTVMLFVKYQTVRRGLVRLKLEKESVTGRLQERERHLQLLEQELFESEQRQDQNSQSTLLEEIRKYKREIQRLTTQVSDLQAYEFPSARASGDTQSFEGIVYRTDGPMAQAVEFIRKIAPSDASVLILGESGTGKELVARAIHQQSRRRDKPFVALNCGALSETLLESELFGHEKGAFTGAGRDKPGRFELADGGTMFLDEVGETSDAFQVKLLRVLQEGEFERVGGTTTRKVDVRIIAATNKDLKIAVAAREFREDIYYRLNTLTIQLLPLRERVQDIPPLVEHCIETGQPGMRVSANVMETFRKYPWKGNVRELQSAVNRGVILARSAHRDIIRLKDLPDEILAETREESDLEEEILEYLREKKFSHSAISETAEELGGLNRGTVAEYFRGFCFRTFCESGFEVGRTVRTISQDAEGAVQARIQKKVIEYLSNAVESVQKEEVLEQVLAASRPKFKNLPQRYHHNLEEILRSFHQGAWSLDGIA